MVASMVGVDGGLGSSTQRALTWKSLWVTSVRVARTVVACSKSEQFAGCSVAFVPVSRSRFVTLCCVPFHRKLKQLFFFYSGEG